MIKIILLLLLALVISRIVSILIEWRKYSSHKLDKEDIVKRATFLVERVIVYPCSKLIERMPKFIGRQFQGEWAIYTTTMTSLALANIGIRYPEWMELNARLINELIGITLSPSLTQYDYDAWDSHPIMDIDKKEGHLSYLSLLALMISAYKRLSNDTKWDWLYDTICGGLAKRIKASNIANIETYPDGKIYIPDNLAAIAALSNYAKDHNGKYQDVVDRWLIVMRHQLIDSETGLIVSSINKNGEEYSPVLGSYSALSIYYLTFVDKELARDQYEKFKKVFFKKGLISGIKENPDGSNRSFFTIDSGPVIFGLSPTGTAFGIGAATYFNDEETRNALLRTGELAGFTIPGRRRHYLLSEWFLVGEAITLAMRTAIDWNVNNQLRCD